MGTVRRLATGAPGLALFFVLVHAWLTLVDVVIQPLDPAGDVTIVYRGWIDAWQHGAPLVGLTAASVYPVVALVPMLLAGLAGHAHYLLAWIALVTVLNGLATVLLARRRRALAWWFVLFLLLLGPVAIVRIDAVALVIAVCGVLAVHRRPAAASALFTLAAWVKVWPGALLLGLVVAGRRTLRVVVAAAATSAAIVVVALAAGARLPLLFSFVAAQTSRGLQIEAPATAPWLWAVALHARGARIFFDHPLVTWEVSGAHVRTAAAVMTWVLAAGVVTVLVLGVVARRRRVPPQQVLALTSLGLVAAVIALNKVGSPQYCTWYVAPVLLGLLAAPRRFRFPAALVLLIALTTQVVYPWAYRGVLDAGPAALVVLDVRNLMELVLLGWTIARLATRPDPAATAAAPVGGDRAVLAD